MQLHSCLPGAGATWTVAGAGAYDTGLDACQHMPMGMLRCAGHTAPHMCKPGGCQFCLAGSDVLCWHAHRYHPSHMMYGLSVVAYLVSCTLLQRAGAQGQDVVLEGIPRLKLSDSIELGSVEGVDMRTKGQLEGAGTSHLQAAWVYGSRVQCAYSDCGLLLAAVRDTTYHLLCEGNYIQPGALPPSKSSSLCFVNQQQLSQVGCFPLLQPP